MIKFFKMGGEFFRGSDVIWYKCDKDLELGMTSLEFVMKSTQAELETEGLYGTPFSYIVTNEEFREFEEVCNG